MRADALTKVFFSPLKRSTEKADETTSSINENESYQQPSSFSFEANQTAGLRTNLLASSATGPLKNVSLQKMIGEQQNNDLYSILLSRIFFQNSKNKGIGKHNVSLILVEALYAIKGLDYLISSKITRSNSIGTTGTTNYGQQQSIRVGFLAASSNQV